MRDFWCITTFFNPAKYSSLLNNYFKFSDKLKEQKVNLLTIELAFGDDEFQIPNNENTHRLRGHSVMWQKERLINYGLSQLPKECTKFGWLDCDVLFFQNNDWAEQASNLLDKYDILQLYKKIYYLPPGYNSYNGDKMLCMQSVAWQKIIHKNWLQRRKEKELPFSTPGFAWAARRDMFSDIGIYDRNIVGSGDTFLVDCYFDSWEIHGYAQKFNSYMKQDMNEWRDKFLVKNPKINYLPVDICHLWHGNLKNRRYMDRHDIILENNYDPKQDIKLVNNVYEWASDKPNMHNSIKQYFYDRKEDTNELQS